MKAAPCFTLQAYEPNTLLLDNALATMGAGLPSAMAVSLLYPQKKVVAVCGDGGFMMNSQVIFLGYSEDCSMIQYGTYVLIL